MGVSLESYCNRLVRSRLHSPEAVKALHQKWQTQAKGPAGVADFVRWLVANRFITEYQAKLVYEGHVDNFFLGKYKVLDRVGQGRMAGVFKAVDNRGQVFAIKVLPPSKARDPELLARFQREARLALQLHHHTVVRAFEMGESSGLHYIVMEYLEGMTLDTLLDARTKLTPKEAVRIGFLTALGLQHLHEKTLVHRDLKPGNLMLCPTPSPLEYTLRSMVKILDIGLARTLFDPDSRKFTEELTNEGTILGTPDYLSPEQTRDARKADIRSDIYSLGCSLYHCLVGQPPFKDNNPVRQILRHATEPPRDLREHDRNIPEGVSRIMATMLAKNPAQRYQTPAQVASALKAFLATA